MAFAAHSGKSHFACGGYCFCEADRGENSITALNMWLVKHYLSALSKSSYDDFIIFDKNSPQ